MSSNLLSRERTTWFQLDPGGPKLNRTHLEETFLKSAEHFGFDVTWAATIQVKDEWVREAIVFAVSNEDCEESKTQTFFEMVKRALDSTGYETLIESKIDKVLEKEVGRYFRFPNSFKSQNMTVQELLDNSAIEAVVAIGEEISLQDNLVTDDYIRPVAMEGKLTLLVERIHTGEFAPIEKRNPHQCCGGDS